MVVAYLLTCMKQHAAMNLKHGLEAFRSPKSTLAQILIPILVTLFFWSLVRNQSEPMNTNPIGFDDSLPPSCAGCNRIVYWPLSPQSYNIMSVFAKANGMSIAPINEPLSDSTNTKYDIQGLLAQSYNSSKTGSNDYYNYNTAEIDYLAITTIFKKAWGGSVGVGFTQPTRRYSTTIDNPPCFNNVATNMTSCVSFTVYSNNTFSTGLYRQRVSAEISDAILTLNGRPKMQSTFEYSYQPNGPSSSGFVWKWAETGLLTFICTFSFIFVFSNVAAESESGMRGYLKTMGLKDWVYWSSWFFHNLVLFTIPVSVCLILGYNLSYFHIFRSTSVGTMLAIVFSYGISAIIWASAFCTIIKRSRLATIIGFFFFIVVVIFAIVCTFPYISYFLNFPGYTFLIPPFHFIRILCSIQITLTSLDSAISTNGQKNETIFDWDRMSVNLNSTDTTIGDFYRSRGQVPWTPLFSFQMMWVNTLIYLLVLWYLDKVFPDPKKATQVPWFPFLPSFWGIKGSRRHHTFDVSPMTMIGTLPTDEDLRNELQAAAAGNTDLSIQGLRKDYSPLPFLSGGKTALQNFYLTGSQGTVIALLGHNGAGKTTLINILTGKVNPTSGEAMLFGYNVNYDMDEIQSSMGICPQHDILWGDLTAQEHMRILSTIKPYERDDVHDLLTRVKLDDVSSLSSQFSGGMKRRLQLAISLLGNPRVIFLDEPTTGMDPVNRRRVWDLIRDLKSDKLVFLTTHAMEEAEVLGEKIAVLVDGDLRSVGSSLHLKNKYATGYRLSLICMDNMQHQVQSMIAARLPEARLMEVNSASLIYSIPPTPKIGDFLQALQECSRSHSEAMGWNEEERPSLIRDWGLSNSTLEDVFLKVTRAPTHPVGPHQIL
eukprot:TRINITY_DN1447_c0_g1_i1.p1 TRINITY_DN1447_c0_g1~~TRINITY_DN1447_c0_g1_i1.p1  ORF type:complete len:880 (+),score=276.45 TRINITY_DN1447_c0_g1_i1:156-2795(+)